MNDSIKRCKQCKKIIVGKSKLGLCPKCADKDKRGVASVLASAGVLAVIAKKNWKAVAGAAKAIGSFLIKR